MSILEQIATKIIKEQELIIGPLAWIQAGKVAGIHIADQKSGALSIESTNAPSVIDQLVGQYERLFGRASREVCKEAAAGLIPGLQINEIPSSLR
jgi:hypothetical protein